MSTHALIGKRTTSGFKARFVHYDGYPEAMMPALEMAMKMESPFAFALSNHWSSFRTDEQKPAQSYSHDVAWYDQDNDIDHRYLYLLDEKKRTIECFINLDGKWFQVNPNNTIKRERK